ncbi:MAG: hypothetical protein VKN83_06595, partial [Cyanobacteriota bacterium]|nr:hypothetical protein [Cyanobacteriota bacterium]
MRITQAEILRLRRRHQGYWMVLATEVALLLLLPLAQVRIGLLSVLLILLALVLMAFISRYSPLRRSRPLIFGLGALAIVMEIFWHLALTLWPSLGRSFTIPHVIIWVLFLSVAVYRKVRTLTQEPFVTVSVVMGAASGYLLVGMAGGVLLTALWVLDPAAYELSALPAVGSTAALPNVVVAPALMAASFTMLTTIGTTVLKTSNVAGQVVTTV